MTLVLQTLQPPCVPARQPRSGRSKTAAYLSWPILLVAVLCWFMPMCANASTYYLSPSGNDGNNGLSTSSSWLTPNHPVNCGDTILAVPGNYSAANFYTGKWGTVSCESGSNVAWLKCQTFDSCKIYTTVNQGMWVDKSYWGVQGWEVTTSASDTYGTCFIAQPNYNNPVTIHHIIFANNVANGCAQTGFASVNRGQVGVDYLSVVGNIAYNAAQGSGTCASGISIYQPVQSDSQQGTHIYVAGNFSYANVEPSRCNGGSPTDGEGIIFDSFDGSQGGLAPYWSQAVAYNNIVVGNGAKGIEVNGNTAGSYHANLYFNQNTTWGNLTDPNQSWLGCSEISAVTARDTHLYGNLVSTDGATGCGGHAIYALSLAAGDSSDSAVNNFAFGYNGNNVFLYDNGSFTLGANTLGVSPSFASPQVPGAPSCSGTSGVTACMASMVADFAPKTASAKGFGYQVPSATPAQDALFPQWMCSVTLPSGLITMGCAAE